VVAGPAFDAGRYGIACAWICKAAQEEGIPAITAMFPENPGRIEFRRDLIVVPTSASPLDMEPALRDMVRLVTKLGKGEPLGPASEEGYLPRGLRKPGNRELPAAQRAVQMLTAKMSGLPFSTELPIEMPERVTPAPALANLKEATLCLASSGGIVPKGNPERLPGGPADVWWKYSIEGMDGMAPDKWECVHRGFHTELANRDPNLVVPLNVVRQIEKDGGIGRILPIYYGTSGRGTSVGVSERLGAEMAQEMVDAGVDGCLFVAT
jgi:glycine reductase